MEKSILPNADSGGPLAFIPYDEIAERDQFNLDTVWLKDNSLEESENLPEPDVIADDLEADVEQFSAFVIEPDPKVVDSRS